MSSAVDLVFLSGPLEGTRVELDPRETLRLGRKRTGLDLEDPLVSLEHATIAFQGGSYWITDVGSASGTTVNGTRVGESAVKLALGDRLGIGEAEIRVEARQAQNLLRVVLVVAILLASLPIGYQIMQSQPLSYTPVVQLRSSVIGGDGSHDALTIPEGFVRREGVDHRGLRHTRTTDMDQDGIQEVWLTSAEFHYPISLDARGAWTYHGKVSTACDELPGTVESPQFECGGLRWTYKNGRYAPRRLDGTVAWLQSRSGAVPHLLRVADESAFKGFLTERGVHEPVHYVLCEGWIEGAPAQALTADGALRPLSKGCLRDVKVDAEGIDSAAPHAMAFTRAGVEALRRDVLVHLSGGEDGRLLDGEGARVREALNAQAQPTRRGALEFIGPSTEGSALAGEKPVEGSRALLRSEGQPHAAVVKAQLLSSGTARLEGGGCVELEVTTGSWVCSLLKACRSGSTFLEVYEVGCGQRELVLTAPYVAGRYRGRSSAVDVVATIDAVPERTRTDVLRTELFIRPRPAE